MLSVVVLLTSTSVLFTLSALSLLLGSLVLSLVFVGSIEAGVVFTISAFVELVRTLMESELALEIVLV